MRSCDAVFHFARVGSASIAIVRQQPAKNTDYPALRLRGFNVRDGRCRPAAVVASLTKRRRTGVKVLSDGDGLRRALSRGLDPQSVVSKNAVPPVCRLTNEKAAFVTRL